MVECHPHPRQDEQLMVKGLPWLLLQGGLMELQEELDLLVLLLLQAELKMMKLLLVDWEEYEAGLGDFESTLCWHCYEQGWH